MKRILLPALALLLAACGSDSTGPDPIACNPLLTQDSGIPTDTVSAADGLKYIERQEGTGTAVADSMRVEVHYTLSLLDGRIIDSSCAFRRPFPFMIGATGRDRVIEGFDRGVIGMQPGGVRRLIIPPSLGYGNDPTNALQDETLIFDVELVDILSN